MSAWHAPALRLPLAAYRQRECEPRGLVRGYAALVGGAVLSLTALNWLVNPWRLYSPSLVPPRVVDIRREKCLQLRRFQPRPEQLVLGSSRTQLFEPARLARRTGLRTFNASLPGATPVDHLTMYRFATETLRAPVRSVILGVEASTLRSTAAEYSALAGERELRHFLPGAKRQVVDPLALRLLVSGSQTLDSVRCLCREFRGQNRNQACYYPDGLIREAFGPERLFPEQWTLSRRIRASMERTLPTPGEIDPVAVRDMRAFLHLARQHGTRVVMVSTPMHAAARTIWRRGGYADDEQAALSVLAQLARENGVPFVDFSAPERYGGDPNGFVDGFHPTPESARTMIDALFPRGRLNPRQPRG